MADKVKVELQDSNGNVYYPFTKFDCVTVDGQSVSKNLNVVLEEFDRCISALQREIEKLEGVPQKIRDIENILAPVQRDIKQALRASEVSEQRIAQIESRLDAAGIPE